MSVQFDSPSSKFNSILGVNILTFPLIAPLDSLVAIQNDWFNVGADLTFRNNLPSGFSYAKYKPKVCRNKFFSFYNLFDYELI